MASPRSGKPLRALRTYGRGRAVRHPDFTYAADELIHLTLAANAGSPFVRADLARVICANTEHYCTQFIYRLYGYCLMPDHLHVLLSPNNSGIPLARWLNSFKSFTTHAGWKLGESANLWQPSGHDHVCRSGETAEVVLRYIVENPVRAGLVDDWRAWPWTRVFVDI